MSAKPSPSRTALVQLSAFAALAAAGAAAAVAQSGGRPKIPDKPAASAPASQPAKEKSMPRVRMKTSLGDIVLELDNAKAPLSTANFLKYVNDGFYDNTIVHRIEPGFVIQAGGYAAGFVEKKTNPPIKNEWQNGLKNKRGTLSLARTGDPDSATSQFFINLADNAALDQARKGGPQFAPAAYAVFGHVVEGMDIVDKIAAVQTKPNPRLGGMPSPVKDVVIDSAKVVPQ